MVANEEVLGTAVAGPAPGPLELERKPELDLGPEVDELDLEPEDAPLDPDAEDALAARTEADPSAPTTLALSKMSPAIRLSSKSKKKSKNAFPETHVFRNKN